MVHNKWHTSNTYLRAIFCCCCCRRSLLSLCRALTKQRHLIDTQTIWERELVRLLVYLAVSTTRAHFEIAKYSHE